MVSPATKSSVIHMINTLPGQDVRVACGERDDFVSVPKLSDLRGANFVDGAGVDKSSNELDVTVDAEAGEELVLTSTFLMQSSATLGTTHALHASGFAKRTCNVDVHSPRSVKISTLDLRSSEMLVVNVRSVAGAEVTHELLSCDSDGEVRLLITGVGNHAVLIGDGTGTIDAFGACTVRIFASQEEGQFVRVVVQQRNETEALLHTLDSSTYTLRRQADASLFIIEFSGVQLFHLKAGLNAEVRMIGGTRGVSTYPEFPSAPSDSFATLDAWTDAVLINGSVSRITIGPVASSAYSVSPFSKGEAIVAINSADSPVAAEVRLESGVQQRGFASPKHNLVLSSECLTHVDDTFTPDALSTVPAPYALEDLALNALGLVDPRRCHVAYRGNVRFSIAVGDASDWVTVENASVPVFVDLGAGDDTLRVSNTSASLIAALCTGRDIAFLSAPLMNVTLDLGEESQADIVDLYYGETTPTVLTSPGVALISPLGASGSQVALSSYAPPQDLVHVRRGRQLPLTRSVPSVLVASEQIIVNASAPGETQRIDLASDTTYALVDCGTDTSVIFDATTSPASNVTVVIAMPYRVAPCSVLLFAGPETTVVVDVASRFASTRTVASTLAEQVSVPGFVLLSLGGLQLHASGVAHFAFVFSGITTNLTLDGTGGADVVVSAPRGSWVVPGKERFTSALAFNGTSPRPALCDRQPRVCMRCLPRGVSPSVAVSVEPHV